MNTKFNDLNNKMKATPFKCSGHTNINVLVTKETINNLLDKMNNVKLKKDKRYSDNEISAKDLILKLLPQILKLLKKGYSHSYICTQIVIKTNKPLKLETFKRYLYEFNVL